MTERRFREAEAAGVRGYPALYTTSEGSLVPIVSGWVPPQVALEAVSGAVSRSGR
ncbi:MAG: hypothetical protein HC923_04550 [Myxococcales bacterium]|nr:hypothetical protein [Myxococcales bacterium]